MESFQSVIDALLAFVETRDPDLSRRGHTRAELEYMALLAEAIGREMNLSEVELSDLKISVLLHDMGKIGIPDAILYKPSQLTEEEYVLIKQHSIVGERLLRGLGLPHIAQVIRSHHERYSGTGYPDGLTGNEIPILARILAVVDLYFALISTRPYRIGLPPDIALQYIERASGTSVDPEIVRILVWLAKRGIVNDMIPARPRCYLIDVRELDVERDAVEDSVFGEAVAFFEQHREDLLQKYEGKFIAVVGEQVVDSDADRIALAHRVYEKYGYRAIYMPKVERTPRAVHIPTPFLRR